MTIGKASGVVCLSRGAASLAAPHETFMGLSNPGAYFTVEETLGGLSSRVLGAASWRGMIL